MKAAIYNQKYWDTLGGGERYAASFVKLLLKNGYKVDIEWHNQNLVGQIKKRFNIDIKGAEVVESINRGDGYDLCYWVSDGSIPTLRSRNNILHFQFPFKDVDGKSLINKWKLFRIKNIVVNSKFTKKFIDKEYGVNSKVIYPPIDIKSFKPKLKENLIIYVGRFSQLTQSKNQHILIENFKKLYDDGANDWKLVLAGGGEIGSQKYIEKLREQAKSYPISIRVSPSFNEIKNLFGKARIFWSAVGFGEDENENSLKVEHFGITVVEALAAKCIPIVPKLGGFKEIIVNSKNGFFWNTESELVVKTNKLMENKVLMNKISVQSQESSKKYSIEVFDNDFNKLI